MFEYFREQLQINEQRYALQYYCSTMRVKEEEK